MIDPETQIVLGNLDLRIANLEEAQKAATEKTDVAMNDDPSLLVNIFAKENKMSAQQAALDVYLMYERSADHFTAQLMRLWMKADSSNRACMAVAFPAECQAMHEWYSSTSVAEFYKRYKIEEIMQDPEEHEHYMRGVTS